jgi:hypothetical protein
MYAVMLEGIWQAKGMSKMLLFLTRLWRVHLWFEEGLLLLCS